MGKGRNKKKKKDSDAGKQSSGSISSQGGGSPRRKHRQNSVRSRSDRSPYGPQGSPAAVNSTADQAAGPSEMKIKLPPIVVKDVPLQKLVSNFASLGVAAEYKLSRTGTKIILRTKAEFNVVTGYLKDSKAEFFTHDIRCEKPFKVVIRGLPNFDPKSVEAEIRDRYKLAPIAIFRMSRRDENTKNYPDCLFLVHFKKGAVTLNSLQAVRSLFSIIIRWEKYRGGNHDVTQCQRCLNFGHGTRNCHIKPRCRNCAKDHATADCPVDGAENVEFKCANCAGAHQGSDRKCPKRDEFKHIRKQASSNNQPGRKKEKAPAFRSEDFQPSTRISQRQF